MIPPPGAKPRRRWGRRLLVALTLVVLAALLVVGAAPYVIAHSNLRNAIVRAALRDMRGTITSGSAKLGWLSPIEFHEIEIRDQADQPVLSIDAFRSDLPLWRLAFLRDNLGTFRCENPYAHVVVRPDGSNFKEVFARPERDQDEPDKPTKLDGLPKLDVALRIKDATISLARVDSDTAPVDEQHDPGRWLARGINLTAGIERAVDDPTKAELYVQPGMLIDQAVITPDVCHTWLKYVAPLLAGATTTEGSFSIDLDEWRVPLDHPEAGRLGGRFIIHSLNTTPGRVGQAIAEFLRVPATVVSANESVVDFRMHDGRVHHRDLKLVLGGLPVETRGSVGLDQTLDLLAKVTLPEFANQEAPVRRAISGRTIEIPIGGTLQKPEVNAQALTQTGLDLLNDVLANIARRRQDAQDGPELLPAPEQLAPGEEQPAPESAHAANPNAASPNAGPAAASADAWQDVLKTAVPLVEEAIRNRRQRLRDQPPAEQPNSAAPSQPMPEQYPPPRRGRLRRGVRQLLDSLGAPQESTAPGSSSPTAAPATPAPSTP